MGLNVCPAAHGSVHQPSKGSPARWRRVAHVLGDVVHAIQGFSRKERAIKGSATDEAATPPTSPLVRKKPVSASGAPRSSFQRHAVLVRESWGRLKPGRTETTAKMMLLNLMKIDQQAVELLEEHACPDRAARVFTVMITNLMMNLNDQSKLEHMLIKLGRTCHEMGFRKIHYRSLERAVLWTLKAQLGVYWTYAHEHAWSDVLNFVASRMLMGAPPEEEEDDDDDDDDDDEEEDNVFGCPAGHYQHREHARRPVALSMSPPPSGRAMHKGHHLLLRRGHEHSPVERWQAVRPAGVAARRLE